MTKKQLALQAVEALKREYPDAICSLDYPDPLQLLISVRLSAQCTDARVNLVTPALFARFPPWRPSVRAPRRRLGSSSTPAGSGGPRPGTFWAPAG